MALLKVFFLSLYVVLAAGCTATSVSNSLGAVRHSTDFEPSAHYYSLKAEGRFDDAIAQLEPGLTEQWKRTPGKDPESRASELEELADCYAGAGKLERADQLYAQASAVLNQRPSVTRSGLANRPRILLLRHWVNVQFALKQYQLAQSNLVELLAPTSDEQMTSALARSRPFYNLLLAKSLAAQAKYSEALPILEKLCNGPQGVNEYRKDADYYVRVNADVDLADCCARLGRGSEVDGILKPLVRTMAETGDSTLTAWTKAKLARTWGISGRQTEAIQLYQEVVNLYANNPAPSSKLPPRQCIVEPLAFKWRITKSDQLADMNDYADLLDAMGRKQEAGDIRKRALAT